VTLKAVSSTPASSETPSGSATGGSEPTAREHSAVRDPQPAIRDPQPEMPALQTAIDVRNVALTVLAVLAVIFTLQYAQAVIIPVVLGILISYALDPIVSWLTRWHIPRALAAGVVLIVLTTGGATLLYGLRTQASAIVEQLPEGAKRLRRLIETDQPTTSSAIQQVQQAATELEKAADSATPQRPRAGVQRVQIENAPIDVTDYVYWGSVGMAGAIGQLVLILFLVYFLLASGDLYRRKLVKIVGPSLTQKKVTLEILLEIDRQIERFLAVQLFTSVLVALVTWLAFHALGVQQAAVWGLLAGLFNSIPYFGPVLVTGGTLVVAFLQFGTIRMALLVAGVSLVITSLEGFLLTPWLTSRAARMNAVAVFVGLLFWGWIWNVWGMLLAVPLLMVIKAVCDHVEDLNPVGELLGD
jgi:predicted PurR-regulated permease PerM